MFCPTLDFRTHLLIGTAHPAANHCSPSNESCLAVENVERIGFFIVNLHLSRTRPLSDRNGIIRSGSNGASVGNGGGDFVVIHICRFQIALRSKGEQRRGQQQEFHSPSIAHLYHELAVWRGSQLSVSVIAYEVTGPQDYFDRQHRRSRNPKPPASGIPFRISSN